MVYEIKTRIFQAGLVLCLFAGQSAAAEEAQLIVYELTNPLLEEGALAPTVTVSLTGEVTVIRPAGFKKPGLHEYQLSDTALASLSEKVASLDTDQLASDALVSDAVIQRQQLAEASGGITRTLHNTDASTVSISVPQANSQLIQQPEALSRVDSLPMVTVQMTQSDDIVQPAADAQAPATSAGTLSQAMNYLYRLPLTQGENSTEVDFDY